MHKGLIWEVLPAQVQNIHSFPSTSDTPHITSPDTLCHICPCHISSNISEATKTLTINGKRKKSGKWQVIDISQDINSIAHC